MCACRWMRPGLSMDSKAVIRQRYEREKNQRACNDNRSLRPFRTQRERQASFDVENLLRFGLLRALTGVYCRWHWLVRKFLFFSFFAQDDAGARAS